MVGEVCHAHRNRKWSVAINPLQRVTTAGDQVVKYASQGGYLSFKLPHRRESVIWAPGLQGFWQTGLSYGPVVSRERYGRKGGKKGWQARPRAKMYPLEPGPQQCLPPASTSASYHSSPGSL